jgi:hypothetical protein
MDINPKKILSIIEVYGKTKQIPEKSYIPRFCEDFDLNYKQWSAYARGSQAAGMKIVEFFIEIFPDLNLNWLLKDEEEMFVTSFKIKCLNEPSSLEYDKPEKAIMDKLEAIHNDIKQMQKNYNLSQN